MRETGMVQQVAQFHERLMMRMMMVGCWTYVWAQLTPSIGNFFQQSPLTPPASPLWWILACIRSVTYRRGWL